ncbi:hypothetical protein D3C84_406230 [compost metagenome]
MIWHRGEKAFRLLEVADFGEGNRQIRQAIELLARSAFHEFAHHGLQTSCRSCAVSIGSISGDSNLTSQ